MLTACYDYGLSGEGPSACISLMLATRSPNFKSEEAMAEKRRDAKNHLSKKLITACIALLLGIITAAAQSKPDPLKSGFENPPDF